MLWEGWDIENSIYRYSTRGVEAFIKSNKHLPEIPSAKEVEENGVNIE